MTILGRALYSYPPVTLGAIRRDRLNRFSNPRLPSIDARLGDGCRTAVLTVAFKNSELAGAEPFTREVEAIDRQPAAQDLTDRRSQTGHTFFKTKIGQSGQLIRRKHDLQPGETLLVGLFHRPSR